MSPPTVEPNSPRPAWKHPDPFPWYLPRCQGFFTSGNRPDRGDPIECRVGVVHPDQTVTRRICTLAATLLAASCAGNAEPVAAALGSTDDGGPGTTHQVPPPPPPPLPPATSTGEVPMGTTSSGPDDPPAPTTEGSGEGGSTTGEPREIGPPFELATLDAPHTTVLSTRGPGQAWADVDGDGWLDLLTVGGSTPSLLWHNEADGTFSLSPHAADLAPHLVTIAVSFADFDNDDDPDLYLLRKGANVLLRNDGAAGWTDVSVASGIDEPGEGTSSTWGDYDGDGWLDLYVVNGAIDADILFHNEGDGHFTNRSIMLLGQDKYQAYGASFSDLDNDGDPDLYVVNDKLVGNQLWRNDGPGCGHWCFTNVSAAWGVDMAADGMGLAVGDFDNDLDLDLSFSDNHRHNILSNTLDQGAVGFTDVSGAVGVIFDAFGWGTIFFDYDSDGWLDLYVADAHLPPAPSSRLFRNIGGTFVDVTASCNCTEGGWSHGVSYADYDQDGAVDFIVGNRGTRHDLYRNRNISGHHWLTVELHGAGPVNHDAVGSRVWVTTTSGQVLMREVKLGSSVASSNSLRLHFGLGVDDVAAVEIRWPDGMSEVPPVPPADGLWVHHYPGI